MLNQILVATDFSTRSDRALRRATLIAKQLGASLTLVHVVDADQPGELIASDETAASSLLEQSVRTIQEHDGVGAAYLVVVDDVHLGVLHAADEIAADLIVIGPHRSRLRDIFVGTTAERVVQRSAFPLLVAVESPSATHRKTLLALGFDEASKSAGREALALGVFEHTEVVLMHAFDAIGEGMMRRAMEQPAAVDRYVAAEGETAAESLKVLQIELGLPPSCQTVVGVEGTPARTILETAQNTGADLIVLGANQRRGLERALIGSVTADVIREAHRDVLIIPVAEEA